MKLVLESTDIITSVDGVPVRAWRGVTGKGTRCLALIHRLVGDVECQQEFGAELAEIASPSRELPLVLVLVELMPDRDPEEMSGEFESGGN